MKLHRLRGKRRYAASKSAKGFTLLETMIAVAVITVAMVAVTQLSQRALLYNRIASSKHTASYLAQEGLEIVRNIRDTNWLEQRDNPQVPWDEGLGAGDWEADFNDASLTAYQGRLLKVDSGFYNYDTGQDTKFQRKITLQKPGADTLQVSVQVIWQESGAPYSASLQGLLYNWR